MGLNLYFNKQNKFFYKVELRIFVLINKYHNELKYIFYSWKLSKFFKASSDCFSVSAVTCGADGNFEFGLVFF